MKVPSTASREEWLKARLALLEKEKAHTRQRDALTLERQKLPWVKLEKRYSFEGANGAVDMEALFGEHNQLIVYHFMFDPDWDAGCKACSFLTDHINPSAVHLAQRDVSLMMVSRAPFEKLKAFQKRMGWTVPWFSSFKSDFNRDFQVSFTEDEMDGEGTYNFRKQGFPDTEAPGISAFAKGDDGAIYHTYSSYGRGLERFIGAYDLLDLVPKGRDEAGLSYGMEWLRLKDSYEA